MPLHSPTLSTPSDSPSQAQLARVLDVLDPCPVECDGFARLATTLLTELSIPHTVHTGQLTGDGADVPVHFWLEADAGDGHRLIADYRARMWCGVQAPHGVQRAVLEGTSRRVEGYCYHGERVTLPPLDATIFALLADVTLDDALTKARNLAGMQDAE